MNNNTSDRASTLFDELIRPDQKEDTFSENSGLLPQDTQEEGGDDSHTRNRNLKPVRITASGACRKESGCPINASGCYHA